MPSTLQQYQAESLAHAMELSPEARSKLKDIDSSIWSALKGDPERDAILKLLKRQLTVKEKASKHLHTLIAEEVKNKEEEEVKKAEEEAKKRAEEEAKVREEEVKAREEEVKAREEEVKAREEEVKARKEEAKAREEEAKAREEEAKKQKEAMLEREAASFRHLRLRAKMKAEPAPPPSTPPLLTPKPPDKCPCGNPDKMHGIPCPEDPRGLPLTSTVPRQAIKRTADEAFAEDEAFMDTTPFVPCKDNWQCGVCQYWNYRTNLFCAGYFKKREKYGVPSKPNLK